MGKIVGLTFDLKDEWARQPGDPEDINAEFDKGHTVESLTKALESGGHSVKRIGNAEMLLTQINNLDVDIIFNLCEGKFGRNRESQVPLLLEMKGVPFVGADALAQGITLDKIVAKKLFIADGIPTAPFFEARNSENLEKQNHVGFPLIVKTRHEGTSKGISQKSLVKNYPSLKRQIDLINKTYRQPALVEKFIVGTEFTVAVLGNEDPQAMPVNQVCIEGKLDLGDDFYSFERIAASSTRYACPAPIPEALTRKLQDIAVRVFRSVECRDYGRIDFRVDTQGNPYVLEINPLPSLDPKDVFGIFPQVIGASYNQVINQILNFALKRYGMLEARPVFSRVN